MSTKYKIIIFNQNLYKEIDLPIDQALVRIGTSVDSDIRLRRNLFFDSVELTLSRDGDFWVLSCCDDLYFTLGGTQKLLYKPLEHGDEIIVKYENSGAELLHISYMIDFSYECKTYDMEIDIQNEKTIHIGGSGSNHICCIDPYIGSDSFHLEYSNHRLCAVDDGTRFGIYVNGVKVNQQELVSDYSFISIADLSFYYKKGKLYTSSRPGLTISGLMYTRAEPGSAQFEYPVFNRNTRIEYVVPSEEVEIKAAPQKPVPSRRKLLLSLLPALVMLAVTIVLRGIIGGGGTFVLYSVISMSLGTIMSVVSYFEDKKNYEEECRSRIETYRNYITEKEQLLSQSRKNELRILNETYRSLDDDISESLAFGRHLFERQPDHEDYLRVFLGTGTIPSANPVKFEPADSFDTEDPLNLIPEQIALKYSQIQYAPIYSDFKYSGCIGVVGRCALLHEMQKNMTLDLAVRQFYTEVKLVYILGSGDLHNMRWAHWLHNVENDRLGILNIACDEESRNLVLEDLYTLLSDRRKDLSSRDGNSNIQFIPHYVVFISDSSSVNRHPLSRYLKEASRLGFTFVFFTEYEELLPSGCQEIIRMTGEDGTLIHAKNGDDIFKFSYPLISDDIAEAVAAKLSAVKIDEVSLEGQLTKNISMFELLGILSVEDLDLTQRWQSSAVYKSMAAPLGVKRKNQIVSLDISDRSGAHGPHGLVAGTTGSGKSEILQTYILSMATLFSPSEVGFVIIDFKGGGMANQFKNLPHLIGTITNIDGREINRSLQSIKAELVKRQEYFSRAHVNHINDYIKLYEAHRISVPLPHLIIIVDEFAELKEEYPDFMKELISAARIGRTLGIHLILATQKPSGVVNSQIWSNSNFRLCLKVQTKEDSNEVIKSPLAAEIVEPGRAYFQVGNNEIFDLFQSAYSGAYIPEGNDAKDSAFSIYERNLWGKKKLVFTNQNKHKSGSLPTQLQAIVSYIHDYCIDHQVDALPGICLPPLAQVISADTLDYSCDPQTRISVPVGIYDYPAQQEQGVVSLELSHENVYIVGSAQTGKTVLLQTILYGLIRKYTPDQVNLYLIDCGSMILKLFDQSNHVGSVVLANEEEKCRNLFRLLKQTVFQRKKLLSAQGIGSYASYLSAGHTDMPLTVLVIDNVAAFREYYSEQAEDLLWLSREAQGVGISLVITATSANALSTKVLANFETKLVLNCNDISEYSSVLSHRCNSPREYPGSGLVLLDRQVVDFQTAIFGSPMHEAQRSSDIAAYIQSRNETCPGYAMPIPVVPKHLALSTVMAADPGLFRSAGVLPIGMDYESVTIFSLTLSQHNSLTLLGPAELRDVFLQNLLHMISTNAIYMNIEVTIADGKQKRLQQYSDFGFVQEYVCDCESGVSLVSDFCSSVSDRLDDQVPEMTSVLIINSSELFQQICQNKTDCRELAAAMNNARQAHAYIIFGCMENQATGFTLPEVLKHMKDEKHGILFAPLSDSKFYDLSPRPKKDDSYDTTVGYLFDGSVHRKIKLFE